jgi:uncharacterized integral membrane protein
VSEPAGTPEPGPPRRNEARSWLIVIALALVLAYLITFAVQNTHKVPIHWVFGTTHSALIWVILVTLILGVIVGALARLYGRRRRSAKRANR